MPINSMDATVINKSLLKAELDVHGHLGKGCAADAKRKDLMIQIMLTEACAI